MNVVVNVKKETRNKQMWFKAGIIIVTATLVAFVATAQTQQLQETLLLQPLDKHQNTTSLIVELVNQGHYRKTPLNDTLSSAILDRYVDSMDPNRNVFLAQDLREFEKHRYQLDNYLLKGDINPAFHMYNRFRDRLSDRLKYALTVINKPFEFKTEESYQFDRATAPWPKNKAELDMLWTKRLKNEYLVLKLTGKNPADIRNVLVKRYERFERQNAQSKSEDVYQLFMNAYTLSIEPHTSYLSPRSSEDFKINMSLSLEGIGASLSADNEYTVIKKLMLGGPADLSGKLHKNDKIIGVGQGEEGEVVDVIGWRLDDVVEKIRGKQGTIVRLLVIKKGNEAAPKLITLIRNKINLQEQAAKKTILEVGTGAQKRRIGVITLPTFYSDHDARINRVANYRSTTRDVQAILVELQQENVDTVLIDLRGNGGGFLDEAISLTGLFISTGPVVQIRDSNGRIVTERDMDPTIAYDGPLAVLVDRGSASASEIFAGAIQDYKRGIIIGEPTFGKGTVQKLYDLGAYQDRKSLRDFMSNRGAQDRNYGQLKVTVAQFFRVNGESTQHRGVVPDVAIASLYSTEDQGESSFKNALPWDKINASVHNTATLSKAIVAMVQDKHQRRIKTDAGFKYFQILVDNLKAVRNQKFVTLVESKRKLEQETREKSRMDIENNMRKLLGLKQVVANREDRDDDEEDVSSKIVLREAANILKDFVDLGTQPAYAKSVGGVR